MMEDREHGDPSRLRNIEDNIRKPRYYRPPNVPIENRKCFGKITDYFELLAQRYQKFISKAGAL